MQEVIRRGAQAATARGPCAAAFSSDRPSPKWSSIRRRCAAVSSQGCQAPQHHVPTTGLCCQRTAAERAATATGIRSSCSCRLSTAQRSILSASPWWEQPLEESVRVLHRLDGRQHHLLVAHRAHLQTTAGERRQQQQAESGVSACRPPTCATTQPDQPTAGRASGHASRAPCRRRRRA